MRVTLRYRRRARNTEHKSGPAQTEVAGGRNGRVVVFARIRVVERERTGGDAWSHGGAEGLSKVDAKPECVLPQELGYVDGSLPIVSRECRGRVLSQPGVPGYGNCRHR